MVGGSCRQFPKNPLRADCQFKKKGEPPPWRVLGIEAERGSAPAINGQGQRANLFVFLGFLVIRRGSVVVAEHSVGVVDHGIHRGILEQAVLA